MCPFALLITWTCYGTWLPGDERGHVSNTWSDDPSWQRKQNTPNTPYRADDRFTRNSARNRQNWPTIILTPMQAECVAETLIETATDRKWRIIRAAVMRNHVHVLLDDCPNDASAIRRVLKGTAQAELNRVMDQPWRWWTAGGSDRYLNTMQAIEAAERYVANQKYILAGVANMKILNERRI